MTYMNTTFYQLIFYASEEAVHLYFVPYFYMINSEEVYKINLSNDLSRIHEMRESLLIQE